MLAPYSVYLVDRQDVRRFICRKQKITDCADLADILLHGAPGRIVEVLEDARGGARPVAVTADPPRARR